MYIYSSADNDYRDEYYDDWNDGGYGDVASNYEYYED